MLVGVVADTACDLPEAVAGSLGIVLVPLHIRFGSTEFLDREELSTSEFWSRCRESLQLPETAAPSPGAFAEAFRGLQERGAEAAVCVTLSSKMSATHDAAKQASKELGGFPVRVVDSLSATMGEGLVCLAAAEAAASGGGLESVVAAAESTKSRLSVFGAIDTLDNLRKGGRIGGAAALVGTLLAIKPVVEVRDGLVQQESRQRTRAKSLRYLADKVRAAAPVERLAVMSAGADDLPLFLEMLGDVPADHPRIEGAIGPVVATHAGPGAIGVAWLARASQG